MFGIGLPEFILIMALALIVVGPDKLPDLARSVAKGILELKKTANTLKESLNAQDNPLNEIRPELEEAAKSIKDDLLANTDKEWHDTTAREEAEPEAAEAESGLELQELDDKEKIVEPQK